MEPLCALIAVICLLLVALWWVLRRPGAASRRRNARAQRGESDAEALLIDQGYRVVGRQVRRAAEMFVDDEPVGFSVRVDLIVERDRRRYVAEVKTGRRAPDPRYASTRRQLLEYSLLFPDHDVLLVDAEAGEIYEIAFE